MNPQITPGIVSLQVGWFFPMEDVVLEQEKSHFQNVLENLKKFL